MTIIYVVRRVRKATTLPYSLLCRGNLTEFVMSLSFWQINNNNGEIT